jgi:selenocysteine lyase/cysteine desulfurase
VRFNRRDSWAPSIFMQLRGETNTPALYAMTDSFSFFDYVGIQAIYERGVALGNYLKAKIAVHWPGALWVERNPDPAFATALTSFNPFAARNDPAQLAAMNTAMNAILAALAAETPKIYIRSVTWRNSQNDPGTADNRIGFRISTHGVYNSRAQIDHVFERLAFHIEASGLPLLG